MSRIIQRVNTLFLCTVALPTLVAIIYFGFIASDIYVSESSFIVRSPQQQGASILGEMLKGAGFSRSQDDSYTIQSFIQSRDALKGLEDDLHIKAAFSQSSIDFFSRFTALDWDSSLENFYRYYQKKIVDVQLDSFSSIATLTVRAYTPEDAYRINKRLLEMSEILVNQLNERGQQDMISFAEREVANAEDKAQAAALELERYRNKKGVIDPEKQSAIPLQEIGKLEDDLMTTETQIKQLEMLAKQNPQLPSLRQRAALLAEEIEKENNSVAGSGNYSLASKATEFRRLALEKEFTDKMLASTMNTLEQARNEAQRKQQYLERIAGPNKPDKAMEPHRMRMIAAVFMLGLIAWGVLSMLIASIKEHQD